MRGKKKERGRKRRKERMGEKRKKMKENSGPLVLFIDVDWEKRNFAFIERERERELKGGRSCKNEESWSRRSDLKEETLLSHSRFSVSS